MPDVPITGSTVPTKYWHALDNGRVQCDLCPRFCRLSDGQRGLCFVRAREADSIVLTSYGRSSGFCVDPVEKKPLNHFLPGTPYSHISFHRPHSRRGASARGTLSQNHTMLK